MTHTPQKPQEKALKSISDINTETIEGRYLMAALAKLTTESQTDKQPDEVLWQCGTLQEYMYGDKPPVDTLRTKLEAMEVENLKLKDEVEMLRQVDDHHPPGYYNRRDK